MLASFLFMGYFLDKKNENFSYPQTDLSGFKLVNYLTGARFLRILKFISVFLFLLTILTGMLGENSSYSNFNMTFFWVIFVLGFTYLTAIIGNVYAFINPWKILTDWLVGEKEKPLLKYPESFGYYPALIFYFIFIYFELMGQTTPLKLSVILLVYTILNDVGVVIWGKEMWFKYCEFFGIFFRLIGKVAPIEYREGKMYLRAPFVGLLKEKAEHFSLVIFILFMLASTAFDGFRETLVWSRLYWVYIDDIFRLILGTSSYPVFEIFGLLISSFIFLGIYLILIYLAKIIAKSALPLKELALSFAFSLVPIALVYNLAHYFTLVFTEGPNIARLLSDPFGFGWNLLNTANSSYGIILGANFVWHAQVVFILIGHIVSVYLTHVVALNVFPAGKRAFWSQFPMLALMIIYTMLGLWILSQPITGGTL